MEKNVLSFHFGSGGVFYVAVVETQQTPFCHRAAKISKANPQGASFLSARFKVPKGTVEDFNVFFESGNTYLSIYLKRLFLWWKNPFWRVLLWKKTLGGIQEVKTFWILWNN